MNARSIFMSLLHRYRGVVNLDKDFIQPLLEDLKFNGTPGDLDESVAWGLQKGWIQPVATGYRLFKINPLASSILGKQTGAPHIPALTDAHYVRHMEKVANILVNWMNSADPEKKNFGLALAQYERSNLLNALQTAIRLEGQYNIIILFTALDQYWTFTHAHDRRLHLAEYLLENLYNQLTDSNRSNVRSVIAMIGSVGEIQQAMSNYQKATEVYEKALELFQQNDELRNQYPVAEGILMQNLGNQHFELGRLEKAKDCYQKAAIIFTQQSDEENLADNYNNLAMIADVHQERSQAMDYLQQALNIYERLDRQEDVATALLNLGVVAAKNADLKGARDYWERSLKAFDRFHNDRLKAKIYHNLANLAFEEGDTNLERHYLKQAIEIYLQSKDTLNQAYTYHNLGRSYYTSEEPEIALEYFEKALALYQTTGEQREQGVVLENIGIIHLQQDRPAAAFDRFEQATLIFLGMGDKELIGGSFSKLLMTIREEEDYRRIFEVQQKIEEVFGADFVEGLLDNGQF